MNTIEEDLDVIKGTGTIDDPLTNIRGLSFDQKLAAIHNRNFYRSISEQAQPQDEETLHGHLNGIPRYAALLALGAEDFGGRILMGKTGRNLANIDDASKILSTRTYDTLSKIASTQGVPLEDITDLDPNNPENDTVFKQAARGIKNINALYSESMQDAYKYVAGEKTTQADEWFHGAGSVLGYILANGLITLGVGAFVPNPIAANVIGGIATGALEAESEAGTFFLDKWAEDESRYDDALKVANYNFLANAPTDMALDALTSLYAPFTSKVSGIGKRLVVGLADELIKENLQEAKQTATEMASDQTYNSGDLSLGNFASNLYGEYKNIPHYLKEQANSVSGSTTISYILASLGLLSTKAGRRHMVDQSLRARTNIKKADNFDPLLAPPPENSVRQLNTLKAQREDLHDKINKVYQSYAEGGDLDTDINGQNDILDLEKQLYDLDAQIANFWQDTGVVTNPVQDDDINLFPEGSETVSLPTIEVQPVKPTQTLNTDDATTAPEDSESNIPTIDELVNIARPTRDYQSDEQQITIDAKQPVPFDGDNTQTATPQNTAENAPNLTPLTTLDVQPSQTQQTTTISGNTARVRTMRGTEADIRYKVVEADSLITSNKDNGTINPDYPQELQPRQRTRDASLHQISKISNQLDPELLGENRLASDGAPIIGNDNVVESGNGRVMGMRQAYKFGRGENYRAWLKNNASRFGLNPDEISKFKNPVLVRERISDVDRVKFTSEANESSIALKSSTEQALDDAKKITPELLSYYDPEKTLSANHKFIAAFGSVIPQNERGDFMQSDGRVSKSGLERVLNALIAKAYNDTDILSRLNEIYDDEIKNVSNALINAAPKMALFENSGHKAEISLRDDISKAIQILAQIKKDGGSLEGYLGQVQMFAGDEASQEVKKLLQFFDKNKRSAKRISQGLMHYADSAMNEAQQNQATMFDDSVRTKGQILDEAIRYAETGEYENESYNQSDNTQNVGNIQVEQNGQRRTFTVTAGEYSDKHEKHKKYVGRYLDIKDENGRTVARYAPYTKKLQMADIDDATELRPQVEADLRANYRHYLEKAGFLDENGKLKSDGNEEYRRQYRNRADTTPEGKTLNPKNIHKDNGERAKDTRSFFRRIFDSLSEKHAFHQVQKDIKNKIQHVRIDGTNEEINVREDAAEYVSKTTAATLQATAHAAGMSINDLYEVANLNIVAQETDEARNGNTTFIKPQYEKDNNGNYVRDKDGNKKLISFQTLVTLYGKWQYREDSKGNPQKTYFRIYANVSTLLHEFALGHTYLNIMREVMQLDNISEQRKQDWVNLLKWLGVSDIDLTKDSSEWTQEENARWRNAHEKFAAASEQYFATGQAPKSWLKRAFEAFKRWLSDIYGVVRNIRYAGTDELAHETEITPDMREVFDRMFEDTHFVPNAKNAETMKARAGLLGEDALRKARGSQDNTQFSNSEAETWSNNVDKVISGKLTGAEHIKVMDTPKVFELIGAKSLPVYMDAGKISQILSKHPAITPEIIKQIPHAITDPIAIFKSATHSNDSIVVMTEIIDRDGGTVIVPVRLDIQQDNYQINRLASIYAKKDDKTGQVKNEWFTEQVNNGNLLYLNNKKGSRWSDLTGLQLSAGGTSENITHSIPNENDLAKLLQSGNARLSETYFQPNKIRRTNDSFITPEQIERYYQTDYWHGTRHAVRGGFQLSKVNTGEGAQMYGYGIYVAEDPDVAEYYRDAGAIPVDYENARLVIKLKDGQTFSRKTFGVWEGVQDEYINTILNDVAEYAERGLHSAKAMVKDAYEDKIKELRKTIAFYKHEAKSIPANQEYCVSMIEKRKKDIEAIKTKIQFLDNITHINVTLGNLYKASGPDSDTLLDWDAPISEQPLKIQQVIQEAQEKIFPSRQSEGIRMINSYIETLVKNPIDARNIKRQINRVLNRYAGKSYPDYILAGTPEMQKIRNTLKRLKDFQDLLSFTSSFLEETDKLAFLGNNSGQEFYGYLSETLGSDEQASMWLHQHGIPGLRYFDGTSRNAQQGTHNAVIWNTDLLKMLGITLDSNPDAIQAFNEEYGEENNVFSDKYKGQDNAESYNQPIQIRRTNDSFLSQNDIENYNQLGWHVTKNIIHNGFNFDFLGTGVGIQAYGAGFYFAELPQQAKIWGNDNSNLYMTGIPDNDVLLDYDATLPQQPEKVKKAITRMERKTKTKFPASFTGKDLYQKLSNSSFLSLVLGNKLSDKKYGNITNPDMGASLILNQAGIPGLRHVTDSENKNGRRLHNFVIWNTDMIRMLGITPDSNPDAIEAFNKEYGKRQDNTESYNQPALGRQKSIRDVLDIMQTEQGQKNSGQIWVDYARVSPSEAKRISDTTGLDISDKYVHTLVGSAINHVEKRHGVGNEQWENQLPITEADYERIPDIIKNADEIRRGADKTTGNLNDTIVYQKRINGHVLIVEEVRTGRKKLAFHTMRKAKAGYVYDLSLEGQPIIKEKAKSEGVNVRNDIQPEVGLPNALSNTQSLTDNAYNVNSESYNQIIGEDGARRLDHQENTTLRIDNLKVAKKMERSGLPIKKMWLATGWMRGNDGKWRMELPDGKFTKAFKKFRAFTLDSKQNSDYSDLDTKIVQLMDMPPQDLTTDEFQEWQANEYQNAIGRLSPKDKKRYLRFMNILDDTAQLKNIIDAPELFKAYPELENIAVVYDDIDGNTRGVYDLDTNTISLNTFYLDDTKILRSTLLHEIQHAIQEIEGFASGASQEYYREQLNSDGKFNVSNFMYANAQRQQNLIFDSLTPELQNTFWELQEKQRTLSEKDFDKLLKKTLSPNDRQRYLNWHKYDEASRRYRFDDRYLDGSDENIYDLYRATAGEVEARNVQSRMNWSDKRRRSTPLDMSEDDAAERDYQPTFNSEGGYTFDSRTDGFITSEMLERFYQLGYTGTGNIILNNKFDMRYKGSNEGSAAYGHGAYLSETPEVAETYRRYGLPNGGLGILHVRTADGVEYTLDGKTISGGNEDLNNDTVLQSVLNDIHTSLKHNRTAHDINQFLQRIKGIYESRQIYQEKLDKLNTLTGWKFTNAKKGNIYTFDLPENEDLLDWDATLENQPKKIRAILSGLDSDENKSAAFIFSQFARSPKKAAPQILSIIQKLKNGPRLDTYSFRRMPEYAQIKKLIRNNDAIDGFRDFVNGRVELNFDANDTTGEDLYRMLVGVLGSDENASMFLNKLGIPGHRYLDGFSRDKGEGTHNFVIWNMDKLKMLGVTGDPEAEEYFKTYRDNHFISPQEIEQYNQLAYHGTDYTILNNKFDLNYAGTGQGSSIIAYGAYLASNPNFAAAYRHEGDNNYGHEGVIVKTKGGKTFTSPGFDENGQRLDRFNAHVIMDIRDLVNQDKDLSIDDIKKQLAASYRKEIKQRAGDDNGIKQFRQKLKFLNSINELSITPARQGNVYTFDIPENNELLNWNAKITSQPKAVKDARRELIQELKHWSIDTTSVKKAKTGAELYDALTDAVREAPEDYLPKNIRRSDAKASFVLNRLGIPGTRYKTAENETAFVIWNTDTMKMLSVTGNTEAEEYFKRTLEKQMNSSGESYNQPAKNNKSSILANYSTILDNANPQNINFNNLTENNYGFLTAEEVEKYNQHSLQGTGHILEGNRVDLKYVGTGEGHAAFGYGIYSAQARDVAEAYRKFGIPNAGRGTIHITMDDGKVFSAKDFKKWDNSPNKSTQLALDALHTVVTRRPDIITDISRLKRGAEAEIQMYRHALKNGGAKYFYGWNTVTLDAIDMIENISSFNFTPDENSVKKGNIYNADLPENDVLLDWDVTLEEQPEHVKEALKKIEQAFSKLPGIDTSEVRDLFTPDTTGEELYWGITDFMKEYLSENKPDDGITNPAQRASMLLNKFSIPGHRYWDGDSRDAKEGTHNFVIWNSDMIKLIGIDPDSDQDAIDYFNAERERQQQAGAESYNQTANDDEIRQNIISGNEAMNKVISEHTDVMNAMYRDDLGGISFFWGEPGHGKKFKGGKGIYHIIAHRNAQGYDGEAVARKMVEVIANGDAVNMRGNPGSERVNIIYDGYTAVLSLYKDDERQTWLLTGWEDYKKSPDASSEGYGSSGATLSEPMLARPEEGAGNFADSLAGNSRNVNNTSNFITEEQLERYDQLMLHGTPNILKGNRFDLKYIGTGEGGQMFGYGAYLAQEKDVANSYRERDDFSFFTKDGQELNNDEFLKKLSDVKNSLPKKLSIGFNSLNLYYDIASLGKHWVFRHYSSMEAAVNASVKDTIENFKLTLKHEHKSIDKSQLEKYEKTLRNALEPIIPVEVKDHERKGNLYYVNGPENYELLDWDKPMFMQSEQVLSKLRNSGFKIHDDESGTHLYRRLSKKFGGGKQGDKQASLWLNNLGIPGHRYLDGASRYGDEGTYNFVIWNTDTLEILCMEGDQDAEDYFNAERERQNKSGNYIPPDFDNHKTQDDDFFFGIDDENYNQNNFESAYKNFLQDTRDDGFFTPDLIEQYYQLKTHATGNIIWGNKFDLKYAGSSEGSSYYGHGAYFEENPEVAKQYRKFGLKPEDRMSLKINMADGRVFDLSSKNDYGAIEPDNDPATWEAILRIADQYTANPSLTQKEALKNAESAIKQHIKNTREQLKSLREKLRRTNNETEQRDIKIDMNMARASIKISIGALKQINSVSNIAVEQGKKGNIYTFNMPEDFELLDWDLTLEQQPEQVKPLIKNMVEELKRMGYKGKDILGIPAKITLGVHDKGKNGNITGGAFYQNVLNIMAEEIKKNPAREDGITNPKVLASMFFNQFGIPGHKFLDQFSRRKKFGTHNYVIWNTDRLKMVDVEGDNEAVEAFNNGGRKTNETESYNQILGEKGTRRLDKQDSTTWRMDNLKVAKKMAKSGKDAKTIRLATGWELGHDGKWKYEVLDNITAIQDWKKKVIAQISALENKVSIIERKTYILDTQIPKKLTSKYTDEQKEKFKALRKQRDNLWEEHSKLLNKINELKLEHISGSTLGEILGDNSEIIKAYPKLKNTKVYLETMFEGEYGEHSHERNYITINKSKPINIMESTLLHEIQHAIQYIENFSKGGNSATILSGRDFYTSAIKEYMQEVLNKNGYSLTEEDLQKMAEVAPDLNLGRYSAEGQEARANFDELVKKYSIDEKTQNALQDEAQWAYRTYKHLPGEVEARNVQNRMHMSEDEHRNTLLTDTESYNQSNSFITDELLEKYDQLMWHGTLNILENNRFDLKYLGTGEGNQSFGYGAYLAQNRKVAEGYARNNEQYFKLKDGRELSATDLRDTIRTDIEYGWLSLDKMKYFDSNKIADNLMKNTGKHWAIQLAVIDEFVKDFAKKANYPFGDKLRNALEKYIPVETFSQKGNIYSVDGPEDFELLDWDAPMKEQPENVLRALRNSDIEINDNETGEQLYRRLSGKFGGGKDGDKKASMWLNDLGIPGHRFFDGFSRGKKDGTHNFVIWNTDTLKILGLEGFEDAEDYYRAEEYYNAQLDALDNDSDVVDYSNYDYEDESRNADDYYNAYLDSLDNNSESYNQIIGEQGARQLDEQENITSRMDNLEIAKDMRKAGKDAKTIRLATGWELAPDGKWRYEIQDGYVDMMNFFKARISRENSTLQEIYNNIELFNAYPELKNLPVIFSEYLDGNAIGYYYGGDEPYIEIKHNADEDKLRSTLIHEIQHAVQEIEGFAMGGNIINAWGNSTKKEAREEYRKILHRVQKPLSFKEYINQAWDGENSEASRADYQKYLKSKKKISSGLETNIQKEAARNVYNRMGGEIEARNAQKRADYNPYTRRNTPLSDTQETSDWIMRDKDGNSLPKGIDYDGKQFRIFDKNGESYSQSANDMQIYTENFKNFFGDWQNDPEHASKFVDDNGMPLVMYHGTGRADRVGSVFRPDRATSGPMSFFTSSREVAESYSRNKADTSLSRENINDYRDMFNVQVKGKKINISKYWGKLTAKQKNKIAQIAPSIGYDYDNDEEIKIITGNTEGSGGYSVNLRQARGNHLEALINEWLNSGNLYGEEEKFLDILRMVGIDNVEYANPNYREEKVYAVYLSIKNPLITTEIPSKVFNALKRAALKAEKSFDPDKAYSADMWDKTNISPLDWITRLKDDIENGTTHAWTIIPDWVTDTLKKLGYDGIKDLGGKYGGDGHIVGIPFYSEQIKSAFDNNGDFDTSNPDIYYQSANNETDKKYFDALNNGDMETAREIIDAQAQKKGYTSTNDFRMNHRAPVKNDEFGPNMRDVMNSDFVPPDYWTNPQYYLNSPEEWDAFYNVSNAVKNNRKGITVYRAVPKDIKEGEIRNGDWVTPSYDYAVQHGQSHLNGDYRIIKQNVKLENLFWNGDSIAEWGYDDGRDYVYKNTKNNRKLNDTITYDNEGNIVPPSKRFNFRKSESYYQDNPFIERYGQGYTFDNPETEKAYRQSQEDKPESKLAEIKHSIHQVIKGLRGDYPELATKEAKSKGLVYAREVLRKMGRVEDAKTWLAVQSLAKSLKGLNSDQLDAFTRLVLINDIYTFKRYNPKAKLPMSFTPESLKAEREKFLRIAQNDTAIMKALQLENKAYETIKQELSTLAADLGMKKFSDKVKRYDFYILDYARLLGGKGINSNYIQAAGEYRTAQLRDIEHLQAIKAIRDAYDKKDALIKKFGKDWQKHIPKGYAIFNPLKRQFVTSAHALTENILGMAIEQAGSEWGLSEETLNSLREKLSDNTDAHLLVLPEELTNTLNKMAEPPKPRGPVSKFIKILTSGWKKYVLYAPTRIFKYNVRNVTGDLDAAVAGNPQSIKFVGQAIKELSTLYYGNIDNVTQELREFQKRGGAITIESTQELGDYKELKEFKHLVSELEKDSSLWRKLSPANWKLIDKYMSKATKITDYREQILRYANYLSYLDQMKKNNGVPSNWGASVKDEIMSLPDIRDRAFKMSNELLGAYDQVSETGKAMRDTLVPFYSWLEVNAKRYYQLIKNGITEDNAGDFASRFLKGQLANAPYYAFKLGKTYLLINLLSMLIAAFNNFVWPDEEDELPPDVQARPHITLGRDPFTGDVIYFDRVGAVLDNLEWFGQDNSQFLPFYKDIKDILDGRQTFTDFAGKLITAPVDKAVNAITPFVKTPMELLTGKSLYPSATSPRNIRDGWQYLAQSFGLNWPYKAATGQPYSNWDEFRNLFVYGADADEAAYFYSLNLVRQFQEQVLGKKIGSFATTKRGQALQRLKTALQLDDKDAVQRYLQEYYRLGSDAKGLKASMRNMNPLHGLNKNEQAQFLKWISDDDRKYFNRANKFFHRIADRFLK